MVSDLMKGFLWNFWQRVIKGWSLILNICKGVLGVKWGVWVLFGLTFKILSRWSFLRSGDFLWSHFYDQDQANFLDRGLCFLFSRWHFEDQPKLFDLGDTFSRSISVSFYDRGVVFDQVAFQKIKVIFKG